MNLAVPNSDDRLALVENFDIFLKIGFIQTLTSSAIESSIRTVASCINNKEYRKRESSFKQVYLWLFSDLGLDQQHIALLDLLRCIRNVNHDNGVYIGTNEDIYYKGSHYVFQNQASVTFLTWDTLLDFSFDIRDLLVELVNLEAISSVGKMDDPSVGQCEN
jgi:hypothetical protein